jgi:hypothetical protein
MDTATESNTNGKRARANAQKNPFQRPSALQDARFAASVILASLPATIKSLAESLLDKFLKLRIELYNHEQNKSRLTKEDFRPISTRFKFNLKASTRVLEQANQEYETLSDSCQIDLAVCKNQLKQSICSLVDLEIKINKTDIATHFCVAVGSLAIACAIATPNIEKHHAEDLVYQTFEKNFETLLSFSEIDEAQDFFDLLKKATEHPNEPHEHGTLSAARARAVGPIEDAFKDLIHTLFVRSWKAYLSAKKQDERDLELQAFVQDRLKRSATEPVAMELDTITADSPALEALINTKISAREQRMEKMISRLSNQVNAATQKNRRASAHPNARTKKTGKPKSNGPKADAPVKDSRKDKQTNGKSKKSTKPTNPKRRVSFRS